MTCARSVVARRACGISDLADDNADGNVEAKAKRKVGLALHKVDGSVDRNVDIAIRKSAFAELVEGHSFSEG